MFASLLLVLGALIAVNLASRWLRIRRRSKAAVLPPGEPSLRRTERVSTRLFTDARIAGGPRPGGYSQGHVTLVLTARRLLVASEWGRALEIRDDLPGEVRWTGPRRVVIEGSHPSGRARVRAEMVLDEEDAWLAAIRGLPGATVTRPPR